MKLKVPPAMPVLILHYREIWLKGANRGFFVQKLKEAVAQALEGLPAERCVYEDHRMFVPVLSHADALLAVERLRKVPGIAYLAVAEQTEPRMDAIVETGCRRMAKETFRTFRVRARRSQKSLPFRSADVERSLGAAIRRQTLAAGREAKVDLANAEATCFVEVTATRALIYHEKIPGSGGLPTGTAGKLVCLLSGGFDSAVAAYKIIKRGVRLTFVHFYGAPARAGEDSPPIARELVRVLTPYQGLSRLHLVPFTDIQREIVVGAPESCRLLLYRRFMLRIAERLAYREGAHGLVTGDSIGQVASQTLHNMQAVGAVASLPVHRPLVGDDKQEILDLARKIGTYDISSEPFTDCCPMFLPKKPELFATNEQLTGAESKLDIPALVQLAVSASSKEVYEHRFGEVRLKAAKTHEPSKRHATPQLVG